MSPAAYTEFFRARLDQERLEQEQAREVSPSSAPVRRDQGRRAHRRSAFAYERALFGEDGRMPAPEQSDYVKIKPRYTLLGGNFARLTGASSIEQSATEDSDPRSRGRRLRCRPGGKAGVVRPEGCGAKAGGSAANLYSHRPPVQEKRENSQSRSMEAAADKEVATSTPAGRGEFLLYAGGRQTAYEFPAHAALVRSGRQIIHGIRSEAAWKARPGAPRNTCFWKPARRPALRAAFGWICRKRVPRVSIITGQRTGRALVEHED